MYNNIIVDDVDLHIELLSGQIFKLISPPKKKKQTNKQTNKQKVNVRDDKYVNNLDCGCYFTSVYINQVIKEQNSFV